MIKKPKAWETTGRMVDRGHSKTNCAVCGKPMRYGVEVSTGNKDEQHTALVGVECATKVSVPQAVNEGLLPSVWLMKHRTRMIKDARRRRAIRLLISLRKKYPGVHFKSMIDRIEGGNPLSPKQACMIGTMAEKQQFQINNDVLPIDTTSDGAVAQIKGMPEDKIAILNSLVIPKCQRRISELSLGLVGDQEKELRKA